MSKHSSGYNFSDITDIFHELESNEKNKMRIDPTDGLAISVANYRNRELHNAHTGVIESDYITADNIREYYSKKLVVRTLKGKPLSNFRQDLSDYLSKGYKQSYPEKYLGMIHKLPEFYFYDLEIDSLRLDSTNEPLDTSIGVKKLTFVKKLYLSTRSIGLFTFWLHDENKNLYCMQIEKTNALLDLFQSLCEYGTFNLSGKYIAINKDDLNYYKINNPRLLFLKH